MNFREQLQQGLSENWHVWLVSLILIIAAWIDGTKLKVPNWITFPMIVSGWLFSAITFGLAGDLWYVGLGWSLLGTVIGLALLLPAYAIGGMGAGDVKLLAGVGAWVYGTATFYGFCASAIIGAAIAVGMVIYRRAWAKHSSQFKWILGEIFTIRDPEKLATIAAERKSSMLLLPYGIPIAIGCIFYFAVSGMLI